MKDVLNTPSPALTDQLCLVCGICCNGVLFKDVQLTSGDSTTRLTAAGLRLKTVRQKPGFSQPCPALDGCACRIYPQRPSHCRHFECHLFKAVQGQEVPVSTALRRIRKALRLAARMEQLLTQLGNTCKHLSLTSRYRQVERVFHTQAPSPEEADAMSELMQVHHELNLQLARHFYPG
jgi:Fe-S-cluster containining protein